MKNIRPLLLLVAWQLHAGAAPHQADRIVEVLDGLVDYSNLDVTFSPFYSDVGLTFDATRPGIANLDLHYNRQTTELEAPFLDIAGVLTHYHPGVLSVNQSTADGQASYTFYDHNSFIVETQGLPTLNLAPLADARLSARRAQWDGTVWIGDALLPAQDPREPDPFFPVSIGLRVVVGEWISGDGMDTPLQLRAAADGRLVVALSVKNLDIDPAEMRSRLASAPSRTADAVARSRAWFSECLGGLEFGRVDRDEERALALATLTLAYNSTLAPGNLRGLVAQFPSRGGFATHYFWDTCFHTLGLEMMDPRLATDALRLMARNMRSDGKISHFMCSTWVRPGAAQPPLTGWAALRLVKSRGDLEFAREILPALIKNTEWWLTQRMTSYGLIGTFVPHETGQNDTPRFDDGPIVAADMNAYLLLQINACAELAEMLGDSAVHERMRTLSDSFGRKMVDVLYDPLTNRFRGVRLATGEPVDIVTPATFLPLLAGVPLPRADAERMIRDNLLNPAKMYGDFPFPSVAYDEPTYGSRNQWRGAMWLAQVHLMLEVLDKYNFTAERTLAARRVYDAVVADGEIREKFDSQTGAGLGRYQQGWTAAILLRLHAELRR